MRKANLLTLGASLLLCVVAAEVGLRAAGIAYPEFNRLDFRLGWSPRPGLAGTNAIEARTGIRINAEGFRDRDHALDKPEGTLRIAVLGDSFTEAREVELEETFWKVMEAGLEACLATTGRRAEVLGFGANGYGTAQELIVLRTRVWKYRPDVVLLAVFTGNDLQNNSAALDGHPDRPHLVMREGRLAIDDSNLDTLRFRAKKVWHDVKHGLYNVFRTVQLGRQAYLNWKSRRRNRGTSIEDQLAQALDPGVYRPPETPDWREAWRLTEAAFRLIRAETEAHGAVFWIATLSNPVQVHPDPALRARYAASLGLADLDYPDRRLAAFARAEDIPLIVLAPPLRAYAESRAVNLHGSARFAGGHWNATGHRVGGEVLAEALCARYGSSSASQ